MTNPFEQPSAAQPAAAPQVNPYAQPAAAPQQAPAQGNPFGPGVQQQPQAPAGNPYAQQAPQAYAPPAQPQYGAAAGQTVAPGWLAQAAPQQQAPAAVAPQAPPALNLGGLSSAPPPVAGEGRGAKLAHMYGRLVLVFPLGISRVPRNAQFVTPEQRQRGDLEQDRMTATVVVLSDPQGGMSPISFGGNPAAFPPVPDTESAPLPYVRKGMWINQSRLIGQLRDFLPTQGGAPGMVCGRLLKTGPAHNDPWYLEGATEQQLQLAGKYLELVQSNVYPHPLAG